MKKLYLLTCGIAITQPMICMNINLKNNGYFGPSPEKIIAVYNHQKDQKSYVYKPNLELIGTINKEISHEKTILEIEKDPCSICLETLAQKPSPALHLPACNYKHWFHRECIKKWQLSGSPEAHNCPTCKQPYTIQLTLPEKYRAFETTVCNELTDISTAAALIGSSCVILELEFFLKMLDWSYKKHPHFFISQDHLIFTKRYALIGLIIGTIPFCEFFSYLCPETARIFRKHEVLVTLYCLLKFRRA